MKNLIETLKEYEMNDLVYCQTHPTLPLSIWNYSIKTQYERLWDEITLMTRGLVVHNDTGDIIARPFKKFFNLEEEMHVPTSDFDVFEKMDGSLIVVFNYDGEWIAASRGSFSSDHSIVSNRLLTSMEVSQKDPEYTYLYELIAPWNRIVVDYGDVEKLVLLGAVHTITDSEMEYSNLLDAGASVGCEVVKRYDGVSDYKVLKGIIGNNSEGFVIRFSNGYRLKIKGEEYLRLHRIMTELSTTAVWKVLSEGGSVDKILENVPDEFYFKIKDYENYLWELFTRTLYDVYKQYNSRVAHFGAVTQKEFALAISNEKYRGLFFAIRKGSDIIPNVWNLIKPEFKKL